MVRSGTVCRARRQACCRCAWVGSLWAVGNDSGEVANPVYPVLGQQKLRQPPDIQLAVRCISQCTIVEIEAVNVDVGTDRGQSP